MRAVKLMLTGLIVAGIAAVAPGLNPKPIGKAASIETQPAAEKFAKDLYDFIKQVESQYVREVPEDDLFFAALSGLYETAREPVPAELRGKLAQCAERQRQIRWPAIPTGIVNLLAQSGLPPQITGVERPAWLVYLVTRRKPFDYIPQPRRFVPWAVWGNLVCELPRKQLHELLTRSRRDLGNPPALQDQSDFLASVRTTSRALDPYCGFVSIREFASDDDDDPRTGLELEDIPPIIRSPYDDSNRRITPQAAALGSVPAKLVVKTVLPGGPAQRQGLRPGDVITRVDGRSCQLMTWEQLYTVFYPDNSSNQPQAVPVDHELQYHRPGIAGVRSATLRALRFSTESVFGVQRRADGSWSYLLSQQDRLHYARVGAIGLKTHEEIQTLVAQLEAEHSEGLILDMRWCPGGYLEPAKALARTFLGEDHGVVNIRYRDEVAGRAGDRTIPLSRYFTQVPILLLVNHETRGGGEMVAAALNDHRRAVVAGERTFGKASVHQKLQFTLPMDYRITVGTFCGPSGKNLQRFPDSTPSDDWGVRPDVGRFLPGSPELSKQLKTWWTWHILRPAGSTEAIPTDDPEADPQRIAAMQILRQITRKTKS